MLTGLARERVLIFGLALTIMRAPWLSPKLKVNKSVQRDMGLNATRPSTHLYGQTSPIIILCRLTLFCRFWNNLTQCQMWTNLNHFVDSKNTHCVARTTRFKAVFCLWVEMCDLKQYSSSVVSPGEWFCFYCGGPHVSSHFQYSSYLFWVNMQACRKCQGKIRSSVLASGRHEYRAYIHCCNAQ